MSNRIITGAVLISIGFFVLTVGGWPLWLFVLTVTLLCAYELFRLIHLPKFSFAEILSYVVITLLLASPHSEIGLMAWKSPIARIIMGSYIVFCFYELFTQKVFFFKNKTLAIFRIVGLICASFVYIYLLRSGNHGFKFIWLTYLIIWTCDIGAYFGGRLFGKHKLTLISPNKTIEGSIIGTALSVGVAYFVIIQFRLPIIPNLILAFFISIVSQLGDLHESLIKRSLETKDSSTILPGHGGIYDRADSSLLIVPIIFYLFN